MRFYAALLALLAPATGLSIFGGDQAVVAANDDLKIPGESPMELCPKDHADDIASITSIDLVPNPPEAGRELQIMAVGIVHKPIEEGAYINLQVKYGLIRLISTKASLCEQIKNVDMECPVEEGPLSILKTVSLPKEIPPGKYTVQADVFTVDDEPITCLTATVNFSRSGAAVPFLEDL